MARNLRFPKRILTKKKAKNLKNHVLPPLQEITMKGIQEKESSTHHEKILEIVPSKTSSRIKETSDQIGKIRKNLRTGKDTNLKSQKSFLLKKLKSVP